MKLWLQDTINLRWANGIIAQDNQLIVAGLNVCQIDLESKNIVPLHLEKPINDFDGLIPDGQGGYFITTVENSGLFHIDQFNNVSELLTDEKYFGDLEFIQQYGQLLIPRGSHRSNEYFISVLQMTRILRE